MPTSRWAEAWSRIDEATIEQRYEAASELVAEVLAEARDADDAETVTRALVALVRLRLALHGPERALDLLAEEPWPDDAGSVRILRLMRAEALRHYLSAYAWKIRQREEMAGAGDDISLWTAERIQQEIHAEFAALWAERESWGVEPLGDLGPYVDQNTYPPRIRGTLRDTITYFWLDLLEDRGWWRAEHESGTYRLDLDALLADAVPAEADAVADPERHPLLRIQALLGDLEAWHDAGERPEAAFEARRRWLQVLRAAFSRAEDRARLRGDLELRLDALGSGRPWWAMGMADLAESHRHRDADEAPDGLIRALEIARAGHRAHPESIGGGHCRHIVESIEAPRYSLQGMAIDGPERRSLGVMHANVDRLWLQAHRVDVEARLRAGQQPMPRWAEARQLLDGAPSAEWLVDLPPTADYRDHRTDIVLPLDPGAYVVTASARGDFAEVENQLISLGVQIADPVPVFRQRRDGGFDITVRSGRHGHALAGASIEVYGQRPGGPLASLVTDAEGHATWTPPDEVANGGRRHFGSFRLLLRHGGEATVVDRWAGRAGEAHQGDLVLLYTDRSVYRPGQEVAWKVVIYRRIAGEHGEAERFEAIPGKALRVHLVDANGETVADETITTGEFGSAAGRFTVPTGRALGRWSLRTEPGDGISWIQVEEYKRPTFEVEFEDPETPLRLNREAELIGTARYYFGLPVTEGQVRWRVERVPVWPTWWFWYRPTVQPEIIADGETALDADGRFTVRFLPEADERLAADDDRPNPWREVGYRYQVSAEVTSEGGETRDAERTVRLGFVAVEARLDVERRFVQAGEPTRITVRRTSLDGQPAAGAGRWRIHRVDQPESTPLPADLPAELRPAWAPPAPEDPWATDDDDRAPRWSTRYSPWRVIGTWPDGEQVASGELEHGGDGSASLTAELDAGVYRVHYRTEDAYGGVAERATEVLVAGDAPLRLPSFLAVESASVEVGETARVLVHSGLDDQQAVLEILHAGEPIERRSLHFERGSRAAPRIVEMPIAAAHRGGLAVRLVALRDHQMLDQDARIDVPWTDRRLDIAFESFRDTLRPGQQEAWSVTVRRADGEPMATEAAEVLAYMFDRGLDLFAEHAPPSALDAYPSLAWTFGLDTAFGMAPTLWTSGRAWGAIRDWERPRGDRLRMLSGWPIGGPGARSTPLTMRSMKMADGSAQLVAEQTMEVVETQAVVADAEPVSQSFTAMPSSDAPPPPPPPPAPEPPSAEPLREDFAETAFWFPDLRTDADGSVRFEFTVPDSVTSWHVWVHALTRDLRGGRLHRVTRTAKDLLVRPQVPRFLREGDRASLRVVVDNTGDTPLDGTLSLDLRDPETDEDLTAAFGIDPATTTDVAFSVGARESTTLRFPLVAPRRPGPVSLTARGRAGEWTDGERRPLPVLPSRLYLSRSRFAMVRGDETPDEPARRVLDFGVTDPESDDPTLSHEAFVVTLDAQLFNTVLRAVPYLIDYPYGCSEQTANRFLATGLLARLFDDHPSVERLAARLAEERDGRNQRTEAWDADDPNRRLLLEETPWLRTARGDDVESDRALLAVLDPEISRRVRDEELARLEAMQTADGGFPWWPGGQPSAFMTLYVLDTLARALEAGLEVPKPMVARAWTWVERELRERWRRDVDSSYRSVAYLVWVLSSYPDLDWTGGVFTEDDRRLLLDRAFGTWTDQAPRTKLYLATALHRAGRADDALTILASVLDSAITDPDLGTYWQPERLAWLWYNDTVETHALALRVLVEIDPDDPRVDGLAQWLLLEKKLSHWKSTRATSEALYALTAYMERVGGFGHDQDVRVTLAGDTRSFTFAADETEPRRRIVLDGPEVAPVFSEGGGRVEVETDDDGFVIASATWHFATDRLPETSDGDLFVVDRAFFRRVPTDRGHRLEPLADGAPVAVGDEVEVQLTLVARHAAEYVHLRDPRGAGFEPTVVTSGHDWRDGLSFYREIRDSGTNFFIERLPAGEVVLRHRLRATMAGTFRVGPATVQSMYAPEFTAHSSGVELEVGE